MNMASLISRNLPIYPAIHPNASFASNPEIVFTWEYYSHFSPV
jgi:hypothetical protein